MERERAVVPLVLLSGLAANEEVFVPQRLAFPDLIVPAWLTPRDEESMEAYGHRMAELLRKVDPRIGEGQCLIGGASFGGIVAMHLAGSLNPRAVVLIGSIEDPAQLPRYIRLARPLKRLVPLLPVKLMQRFAKPLTSGWARRAAPHLSGLASQFRSSDPKLFRWSVTALLQWKQRPNVSCPVRRVHGARDRVLPVGNFSVDRLIDNGGHVISLTHGADVNRFLRSVQSEMDSWAQK